VRQQNSIPWQYIKQSSTRKVEAMKVVPLALVGIDQQVDVIEKKGTIKVL
jgi:hypothetical protein